MKNFDLNLNACGVSEISEREMKEVNGGVWWSVIVAYILLEALVNPTAHCNALVEGFNSFK